MSLNFKTSCYKLKPEVWEQKGMRLFYYFKFGRNDNILKSNINFNKNETESEMENLTNTFRETNLVLQFTKEPRIKSRIGMSWSSRKKRECIFCIVYFVGRKIF